LKAEVMSAKSAIGRRDWSESVPALSFGRAWSWFAKSRRPSARFPT
jgi:hypothetical protein